ncbi:hypothetical protein HDV05_004853 [Chytridiales sp. JEL 0842]|nr:hypothetical protein HDV05_004853 [Chytridiales sp. JEL 0842]
MPHPDNLNEWHGTLFVHRGYYKGGVFKFVIDIPDGYPDEGPSVRFITDMFHPLIDSRDRHFSLRQQFPSWRPHKDYLCHVLHYIKNSFREAFLANLEENSCPNKDALRLFHTERHAFSKLTAQCAELSASEGILYDTETPDGSLIQFAPLDENQFDQIRTNMLNILQPENDPMSPQTTETSRETERIETMLSANTTSNDADAATTSPSKAPVVLTSPMKAAAAAAFSAALAAQSNPKPSTDSESTTAAEEGSVEEAIPPNKTAEEKEQANKQVESLVAEGKKALVLKDLERAVGTFGDASRIMAETYGPNAIEGAEVLLLYGSALYENAVAKSSPLGGPISSEETVEAAMPSLMPPAKSSARFVFNGDDGDEEETEEAQETSAPEASTSQATSSSSSSAQVMAGENEEEEEVEEEEDEDFQIAWETLDLARVLYEKSGNMLKLSEVLVVLADISLEIGHWDQAIEDYKSALKIMQDILEEDDRKIAETHYRLALALELAKKFEPALKHVQLVSALLNRKVENLKLKLSSEETKEIAQLEIDDIEALIPDITAKVEEIKNQMEEAIKDGTLVADEEPAASVSSSTSKVAGANDISSLIKPKKPAVVANDISTLVKSSKRKADVEAPVEDAKKVRTVTEEEVAKESAELAKESAKDS